MNDDAQRIEKRVERWIIFWLEIVILGLSVSGVRAIPKRLEEMQGAR